MRPGANDRLFVIGFVLLAVSSLGLKAAAGPPRDGLMDVSSDRVEQRLSSQLMAQHFAVTTQRFNHRSSLVIGVRGSCRVGVRDAREGVAHETLFARDAIPIGSVRYLYGGRSYDNPPTFTMRLGRIQTELLSRLGMAPHAPIPIAFAASPACGPGDFGLGDVRV